TRFRLKVTELAMAERRKTANSRKPATRKTTRKTSARKVDTARRKSGARKASPKRWSQRVTRESDEREEDRGLAQALSRTQFAPQGRRLSLGALDADVLYQPRRQDLAKDATRAAAAGEGRVEAAVWKRVSCRRPRTPSPSRGWQSRGARAIFST